MKENYYALMVCIFRPCTPEQAFELMKNKQTRKKQVEMDPHDLMFHRSEGYTYKEIGEMYGTTDHAVYVKIKRYKELAKAQ